MRGFERNGNFSTVALLAEQAEADKNENEHKKKNDHNHPQLAERLPSKAWHAQIIVEGGNEWRFFARYNRNPNATRVVRGSMNVFEANAAELEKLREKVDEMFRERSKSPEHMAAWQEAARAFHTAYDKPAFPGGLSSEFELLRVGDVTAIEMAIQFLEANPWFFRSGYTKSTSSNCFANIC